MRSREIPRLPALELLIILHVCHTLHLLNGKHEKWTFIHSVWNTTLWLFNLFILSGLVTSFSVEKKPELALYKWLHRDLHSNYKFKLSSFYYQAFRSKAVVHWQVLLDNRENLSQDLLYLEWTGRGCWLVVWVWGGVFGNAQIEASLSMIPFRLLISKLVYPFLYSSS